MPINGNALAKYLVMMSQVIAWFTVSVMLLRRGLNQVNADGQQQPSMYKSEMGMIVNDTTVKPDIGHHNHQGTAAKPFDESGTHAVVAGVIMITIAVIMLIISPTIMLMKMVDKRNHRVLDIVSTRQKRFSQNINHYTVIIVIIILMLRALKTF
jgi:hypothetical protein